MEEVDSTSETVQPTDRLSTTDVRHESDYKKQSGGARKKVKCAGCKQPFNRFVRLKSGTERTVEKCTRCWLKEVTCNKCQAKGHYATKCTKPSNTKTTTAGSEAEDITDDDDFANETQSADLGEVKK